MTIMYSVVHDVDIVNAFAAYLEADLQTHFKDTMISGSTIGAEFQQQSLWTIKSQSDYAKSLKSDCVSMYVSTDALDEDLGALWYVSYVPSPMIKEWFGIPVPEPESGFTRPDNLFSPVMFQPLPGGKFRLTSVTKAVLPKHIYFMLHYLPNFFSKSMQSVEVAIPKFREHAKSELLQERMRNSTRSEFYKRLREHVASKPL